MSSRRKVDTSDLHALREKLIKLYEVHGDSKAVAAEMNISQPRLSEIISLCHLKIQKRLVLDIRRGGSAVSEVGHG